MWRNEYWLVAKTFFLIFHVLLINFHSFQEVQEKLKNSDLDDKERIKLELEIKEVKKQEEEYQKKEKELDEKEKNEPWNVDTIGHEAFSKSVLINLFFNSILSSYLIFLSMFCSAFQRINKITDKKSEPPKLSEEEETKRMVCYLTSVL